MVHLQSIVLAAIPNSPETSSLWEKACHIVFTLFSSPSFMRRCFQLALAAAPSSLPTFVLLSVIVSYCTSQKGDTEDWLKDVYVELVNCFISSVLGRRERPDKWVIGSCGGLFKRVTHSTFKELFLPAIKKALLRNPEELMSGKQFYREQFLQTIRSK